MSAAAQPLCGRRHRTGERGIAIVVVLVAMVALSFTAIAALRGSASALQVSDNAVAQAQARAAARGALRYCERAWRSGSAAVDVVPPPAAREAPVWTVASAWFGPSAQATSVPDAGGEGGEAPKCMVQASAMAASGVEIATVTARGFSPGFTADDAGRSPTGASAMLQSVVTRPAP
jgi:type IV pilus assembly protein PilX